MQRVQGRWRCPHMSTRRAGRENLVELGDEPIPLLERDRQCAGARQDARPRAKDAATGAMSSGMLARPRCAEQRTPRGTARTRPHVQALTSRARALLC